MRIGTIALASRRSGKQHPKGTAATKSVGAAWLVTLWGSGSAAGTAMAYYSCAARSRAPCHGAPAFAVRFSSFRRGTISMGSRRSWSVLAEDARPSGTVDTPSAAMSARVSLGCEAASHRATADSSTALTMSSRGWDVQAGWMGSGAGVARGFSSGTRQPALGFRRSTGAPTWKASKKIEGEEGPDAFFDAAELLKMSYRDLQQLAKTNRVRANQTVQGIVNDLVALKATDRVSAGVASAAAGAGRPAAPSPTNHVKKGTDFDGFYDTSEGSSRKRERGRGRESPRFPAPMEERSEEGAMKGGSGPDLLRAGGDDDSSVDSAASNASPPQASSPRMELDAEMADVIRGLEKKGGGDKGGGWVTLRIGDGDGDALEGEEGLDADEVGDEDGMEARLRDARASNDRLSEALLHSKPQDFGFSEDRITLDKLKITVPTGCCPGCGSKFQADDEKLPGYLQADKLEAFLSRAGASGEDQITPEDVDMDPETWVALQTDAGSDPETVTVTDVKAGDRAHHPLQPQRPPGAVDDAEISSGGLNLGRAARDSAALKAVARAPRVEAETVEFEEASPEREDQGMEGEEGREGRVRAGDENEKEEEEDRLVVCQRCHRLRYYGSVEESLRPGFSDSDLLTPQRFVELLGTLKKQRCLIVYLVDLFDFHGTFLYNLPRITGNNPVLVAGNKVDLLPKDLKKERVTKWVRDKCRESGLPAMEMRDVHLISSKLGVGIAPLMRKAREQALRDKRDIYVLGAANVGKSTFINYIIQDRGNNGGGELGSRRGKGGRGGGEKRSVPGRGVTVSSVPGTTLDFLKVDLGEKRALYDTPGLLMPHTLTSRLNAEELRAAIPKKKVDHVTFRLGEGKVVLLGGLARVEVLEGRPFLLTFFVSNEVRLHPTDVTRVDDMLSEHVGTGKMIFPPFAPERVEELGEFVPTDFDIMGAGWRESAADVVIAGLGWVSATGAGPVTLRVWAPRGVLVMAREPLLPFESWETTAKFTGGSTVKKGKKKQGRRA